MGYWLLALVALWVAGLVFGWSLAAAASASERLRRLTERQLQETSPPELSTLPDDFRAGASVVEPIGKRVISLRVDVDVWNELAK